MYTSSWATMPRSWPFLCRKLSGSVPVMIVLCTGCRGGFGKLIAVTAARAGHTVYAGVRDPAASPELIEASRGLSVVPIALDVTDERQRDEAVERIVREKGR